MFFMIEMRTAEINRSPVAGAKIGDQYFPETLATIAITKKGLVVCRNLGSLNGRNVTAAKAKGLTKLEDALEARIESCTSEARALGVAEGMAGKEALMKLQGSR